MRFHWWRRKRNEELQEEIHAHLTLAAREEMEAGEIPSEAQLAARHEFGNVGLAMETTRDMWGWRWLADFWQDSRYGLRMLRKNPGFTTVAVLALALGIGANTAIFSLIDAVMLRSLPVRDPQQLVILQWNAHHGPKTHGNGSYGDCETNFGEGESTGCSLSKPFVEDVRSKTKVFSGMAAFAAAGALNLSGNGPASQADALYVSGDYFETLGVRAAAGRLIQPTDDQSAAPAVTVLNFGYWQSAFGGDPSAVGKTIHLKGVPFTIIGVAESRFVNLTPGNTFDLWIPLARRAQLQRRWKPEMDDDGSWWVVAVARLKSGVSRAQAESAVSMLFFNEMVHGAKPMSKAEDAPSIRLLPAQTGLTGSREDLSTPLYVLMLAVGIVLLIACANVAGLMLARSTARQKETALRLALGASRGRIARQVLTESLTISVAGGLLGIVLAFWSARALLAFLTSTSSQPTGFSADIDLRVLAFTAGASIVTGILFGLAPAFGSMRVDLTPALKEGAGSSAKANAGRGWFSSANALVVAQVALTVVVLVGAGLMVHTLENLRAIDPGFDTNNVLTFGVESTLTGYQGDRLGQFFRQLRDRFSEIPGVLAAGYSDTALLSGGRMTEGFHLHGKTNEKQSSADVLSVGPGFFRTMKIPLTAGRDFEPLDYTGAGDEAGSNCPSSTKPKAAIANESFVRAYFPDNQPIGQRFGGGDGSEGPGQPACKDPGWEIIGVVQDAKYSDLRREVQPTFYTVEGENGIFELRTAGDPRAVIPAVRNILQHTGFDLPLFRIKTQSQQIDELLFTERLIARLSSFFGLLALLLACVGIYGLLSYEVARHTRETGIRMALGAQPRDVLSGVVGHGITLAAIGVAIGGAASLGVTRFLGSMLYNVKPNDPLTLAAVTVLLLLVALAACYIPARRATRVDPLVALRCE